MKATQLFSVLLLALILSLTLVSAAISFSATSPSTLTKFSNTTTFTITANENVTISLPSTVSIGNTTVTVSPTSFSLNTSQTKTITLSASSFPTNLGTYSGSLIISANATDNQTVTVNSNKGLCSDLNNGELAVDNIEINVKEGFGDDDNYLYPLDKVEVKFNVDNTGNWDIKNIEINACLFDKATSKCVMDEGDMEISNDNLDLKSGKDDDVTLAFTVDPDQLKVGNDRYTIYVSANGEIDDNDANSNDGAQSCSSDSKDIEIRTTDEFAIVSDILYNDNLACGETLELSANVWNIGDNDFADDEIYFEIYSKELGIDKEFTFDSGIDSMEKQFVQYSTKLPANLSAKSYKLQLSVLDDNHRVMQNKEDDKSQTTVLVTVGSCIVSASASINASLSEETPQAKVGGEVVVNTVIKNTGASSATFTVSVPSIDFAQVSEIDPTTFTLAAGESKDVSIYLNINSNTKVGNKEFTIRAVSGQSVSEQKVKLAVQEGFSASGLVNHFKNNWVVYLIILVNLILIIAIISVVVRIVNKSD